LSSRSLGNRRTMADRAASVLVVEDEALIRLMLVDMLEQNLGHRVVGEAGSLPEGKSLAENAEFDLAILDVNLDGWNVLPVAQTIEKRGLPFLFVSGYKRTDLPAPFRDRLLVEKPIEITKLKAAISEVLGRQSAR
jgi:CheY-like chemotaxis protein